MRRLAAVLLLCHAALAPSGQAQVRVLLLASESHAAEWEAALRVELVASGGDVVLGAAPGAPTRVERDAEAMVAARDAAAHAAVWVEPDTRGELTVRVVDLVADTARSAPLLGAPDGRTIALLAVSLLEERVTASARASSPPVRAPAAAPLTARGSLAAQLSGPLDTTRRGSTWRIVDHVPDGESPYQREVALREAERRAPAASAYGMIGLGGFALTQEGGSGAVFDPGSMLRLAIGAEIAGFLRLGGILDGGFVRERFANGLELQPWIRACPEIGFVGDLGKVSLHAGAHGCGSIAELGQPAFDGSGSFHEWVGPGWSAGGFVAISFRTSRTVHIYIRGDLDGTMVSQWGRGADFVPVLASMVSFE